MGNRFIVTLHSLKSMQTEALAARAGELAQEGLPNYFDEQRFGSYAPGGAFIGKAILRGDAEGALRAYMAQPVPGDPPALRSFKAFARDHWRDWSAMFQRAPRSNHRSILTFLKDHPEDFRKALNLITPRLLPLLLAAYQSFLWNRMACRILRRRLEPVDARAAFVEIAGEQLILYQSLPAPLREELRRSSLPLPHHRAAFPDGYSEEVAEAALAEEGLELKDLKARLLKRAYLPRGARPLLVFPEGVETQIEAMKPGDRRSVRLAFFLSPGSYGTLVLKALAATVS